LWSKPPALGKRLNVVSRTDIRSGGERVFKLTRTRAALAVNYKPRAVCLSGFRQPMTRRLFKHAEPEALHENIRSTLEKISAGLTSMDLPEAGGPLVAERSILWQRSIETARACKRQEHPRPQHSAPQQDRPLGRAELPHRGLATPNAPIGSYVSRWIPLPVIFCWLKPPSASARQRNPGPALNETGSP
jgi:hypothetical protein